MRKGQRPSKHSRVINTRAGKKKIIVNANIKKAIKPAPKLVKKGENRSRIYTKWGKQEAQETIDDFMEDEGADFPTLVIQMGGDDNFWNADVGIGWYRGPEIFNADIQATDAKAFDRLLREVLLEATELTDGRSFPIVRLAFDNGQIRTIQDFAKYNAEKIREYLKSGGQVLENIINENNMTRSAELMEDIENGGGFRPTAISVPGWAGLNLDKPRAKPELKKDISAVRVSMIKTQPRKSLSGPDMIKPSGKRDIVQSLKPALPKQKMLDNKKKNLLTKKERRLLT